MWCTRSRVLLRIEHTLLSALSFGEDLLEILVPPLGRSPVGIAEWLGDFVHIETIEESRVRLLVRGGCYWGHSEITTMGLNEVRALVK